MALHAIQHTQRGTTGVPPKRGLYCSMRHPNQNHSTFPSRIPTTEELKEYYLAKEKAAKERAFAECKAQVVSSLLPSNQLTEAIRLSCSRSITPLARALTCHNIARLHNLICQTVNKREWLNFVTACRAFLIEQSQSCSAPDEELDIDKSLQPEKACEAISLIINFVSQVIESEAKKHRSRLVLDKKRNLEKTLPQLLKSFLVAMGYGPKANGIIDDALRGYQRFSRIDHKVPVEKSQIENFLRYNSIRQDLATCSTTTRIDLVTSQVACNDNNNVDSEKEEEDESYFSCPLVNFVASVLNPIMLEASKGVLGEGHLLLKTIQDKFPEVKRIISIDGTHNTLNKNASEASLIDGAKPNSCKGLSGGSSRKLHAALDLVSCATIAFKITSGVGSEREVVSQWLDQGKIQPGDLIIADAGYISKELFDKLQRAGVYYLIKGKQNANPLTLSYVMYQTYKTLIPQNLTPASSMNDEWSDWLSFVFKEQGTTPFGISFQDIECEENICIDALISMPKVDILRLIKVYNPHKKRNGEDCSPFLHFYTNLNSDCFSPMDIWGIYKARWQSEIMFKGGKSCCFMDGWLTGRVGRADFYVLLALTCYHIKILIAQQLQKITGKHYTMLSACDIDEQLMACYLGYEHASYGSGIAVEDLDNLTRRSKVKIDRIQAENSLYARFGAAVWIFKEMKGETKARVSYTNRIHLKSLGFVAKMMAHHSVPDLTLSMPDSLVKASGRSIINTFLDTLSSLPAPAILSPKHLFLLPKLISLSCPLPKRAHWMIEEIKSLLRKASKENPDFFKIIMSSTRQMIDAIIANPKSPSLISKLRCRYFALRFWLEPSS